MTESFKNIEKFINDYLQAFDSEGKDKLLIDLKTLKMQIDQAAKNVKIPEEEKVDQSHYLFEPLWEALKHWDIGELSDNLIEASYKECNGSHIQKIIDIVESETSKHRSLHAHIGVVCQSCGNIYSFGDAKGHFRLDVPSKGLVLTCECGNVIDISEEAMKCRLKSEKTDRH